ncbi:nucleolin 2-like isoform X3 [Zingiber officinale]|uniref:nucleolin 2-like isoform X3 n=1 Tax=Zingiber officinale TaxID=94328 RepID=UPI001C4A9422|nr:nucleolin 2-like isoform X3 [Zingiber officinale]
MGKSSKKTNVEVAPAIPAVSAKPGKKGKRDAEVTLEKEGSAKKQKKEIENAVPKGDIRNLKKALKNAPLKKKPETSSSEDDSSSDSEEVKVPPKKQSKLAKSLKKKSSSSEESSSDDEPVKTVPASDKKAAVATKNGSFAAVTKKGKESSSSESDSDEDEDDSDESDVAPQLKKSKIMDSVPSAKTKPVAKIVKKESSNSEEDEDDSSEESSDDEPSKQQQAKKDSVSSSKTKPVAKTVKKESSSSEEDEDDSSEESSDDEPSKQQQIKKVIQASKKSNSSDSSEESSDEESEDEEPLKTPKKDNDVEMKDASVVSAEKQTATKSEKKTNQAPGSRTLFIGNLSYDVGQDDVAEFFKTAGEVVDVRLATAEDGSFKGFGHVEFATEEDAKKALELNGNELFGRGVRLDVARERGSYTPQSGKDNYQKGSKGQSQTIFVKGFDRSLEEDQVRSSLEEHFGSCGDITRISVPKDYETGAPKGIAYIDFKDQESFNKAYELNGSDLGGYTLTVDEAKPRTDNRDGGWSGGRDGGGRSGGRFGGRDGGRRGGRGDRGRGRDFGGRGRGRGRGGAPFRPQSAGTASTGSITRKKTTFGDD